MGAEQSVPVSKFTGPSLIRGPPSGTQELIKCFTESLSPE